MHPGRVISTFVGLDAVIGALTANGAAIASDPTNSASELRSGRNQFRASILMQLFCFICFIFLEITFHRRCLKAKNIVTPRLRSVFFLLYASSGLILVRNIYRVIEVFQGYDGYIGSHEAFFYVFDGVLMIINTVMFNIMHPMMFLPNSVNVYLATDGHSERMGPGWMDKRNFFVTLIDPFDVVGLIRGKDKKEKFWERGEDFPIVQREEGRGWRRNTKGGKALPPPPPPPSA
ncbi:hypothetical protein MMC31_003317 [Peltigera leucophlebia]|nr:hypothetical protein [Peltigera leucophlebia]